MPSISFPSVYYTQYTIRPKYWFIREESIDRLYTHAIENAPHETMLFHVSAGDYISTLATILRFFEECVFDEKTTPEMRELQLGVIRKVISDLLYLNKHYTIVPMAPQDKKTVNEKSA